MLRVHVLKNLCRRVNRLSSPNALLKIRVSDRERETTFGYFESGNTFPLLLEINHLSTWDTHMMLKTVIADQPINPTSPSLIIRARKLDKSAWERLSRLYTPLVWQWTRKAQLQNYDAADVVQEVFHAVAKSISKFESGDDLPPFRAWLWGITRHKILDHFRKLTKQPNAAGGTNAHLRIMQLAEEDEIEDCSSTNAVTDKDGLAYRALQLMKTDFKEKTWQVFWRVTIEEESPADVAKDLCISVSSVYTAKSRVLSHLRRELAGLT